MAARYRKAWELQALGRDLARLERICRSAETVATIKCGVLRPIACRRRFRVIRACAVDTHDGEVESEGYITCMGGNCSGLGLWKRAKVFSDAG